MFTNSLRSELLSQGTQVLGAHLGYTDTPMTANVTAPKGDPSDVVAAIYDGLEAGAHDDDHALQGCAPVYGFMPTTFPPRSCVLISGAFDSPVFVTPPYSLIA